jgi:predicted nucleic acid-binding protein
MTAVFADTFYWVALADASDSAHQRALTITAERASSEIVTTDEVLGEYLTFFASGSETLRHRAATSVQRMIANPVIRVIPQSRFSFLSGLELYGQRPDKGYSLIDCISM